MKFSVTKDKLLEGLQHVQNIVSTKTTLPILSNVHIQAGKKGIQLSTTDLEVGVRCSIEGEIQTPGATTLPAKRFSNIVRELPFQEMSVEVDDKNIAVIQSGQAFFKIMGLPEEEFPPFPKFDETKTFKIEQKVFKDILRKTSYASSTDETRYVLNGVLLSFKDNKLTVVATDGRRMALIEQDMEFSKGHECDVILPTKAVNELGRLLGDSGEVKMVISENQISFSIDSTLLVSKLIEGTYPNFRQVIPTETKERVTIERELFMQAVHRVAILVEDKTDPVKLTLSKNNLLVFANIPEVGEAKENLAVNYKGREVTISFKAQYLLDPLRNLDTDTVIFELSDTTDPGVIKNNTPFLYVIMPMRPGV